MLGEITLGDPLNMNQAGSVEILVRRLSGGGVCDMDDGFELRRRF
jgi:hypothetical protein